jgi:NADPH:quinone reductase-like Zn-dependent oxidoreductase
MGARSVSGIIRSPQHRARLEQAGIYPILDTDRALMEKVSQHSDLVFDAVGGELANTLLSVLPASSTLISYGLIIRAAVDPDARQRDGAQVSSAGGAADTQRGGVAGGVRRDLAAAADDHAAAGPAGGVERLAGGDCRRRPAGKRR